MAQKRLISIVAGKSGGHIIPGIIFARNEALKDPELAILFFSTDAQLDRTIMGLYPYVFSTIALPLNNVPGKKIWRYPIVLYQFIKAFFISIFKFIARRPERLVSMGGFVSVPVCLAAWILRIPIDLFELNVEPGKAIYWTAPLARTIYICFPEAATYLKKYNVKLTSYPVRFSSKDYMIESEARVQLGLSVEKKCLLIVGGSQGSHFINDLALNLCRENPEIMRSYTVIHQTGAHQASKAEALYKSLGIEALVFEYSHDLQLCYAAADYCIARAGAGTLFELEFFNKKSLIIPLEIASTSHQLHNAQALKAKNPRLFSVIRQSEVATSDVLRFMEVDFQ